jgi:SAM-dependent methyltransferase
VSSSTASPEHGVPERIDPLKELPGVVAHHLKKYDFAREAVSGVLIDVACGVGYGTSHLAEKVSSAFGIEIAADAITIAAERYTRDNVQFVQGNAEHLPFGDASVDGVTCFEGIEHFEDPGRHLDEVRRVLRPGGCYVASTPNPLTNPHDHENPFHLHEFDAQRLEAMLTSRFSTVAMLGQFRTQSPAHRTTQRLDILGVRRWKVARPVTRLISRRVLKTAPTEEATMDDFVIRPFAPDALEYVVVCRKAT